MNISHSDVIDHARAASDSLLTSELTPSQQQYVVDLLNACQDLNTLYWEGRMSKDIQGDVSRVAVWGGTDTAEVTIRIQKSDVLDFHVMDRITINVKEG